MSAPHETPGQPETDAEFVFVESWRQIAARAQECEPLTIAAHSLRNLLAIADYRAEELARLRSLVHRLEGERETTAALVTAIRWMLENFTIITEVAEMRGCGRAGHTDCKFSHYSYRYAGSTYDSPLTAMLAQLPAEVGASVRSALRARLTPQDTPDATTARAADTEEA